VIQSPPDNVWTQHNSPATIEIMSTPSPTASGGIPRYRPYAGPAVFSEGFRPFFLAVGLWAPIVMALWIALLAGQIELPTAFGPLDWHVHEMLFGFAGAAAAGFFLTAIPNWTGRLPLQGAPLMLLAALWLAGRIACAVSALTGPEVAAAVDLAFLFFLLLAVIREIAAGRNWRNLPMVGALAVLLAANLMFHLESLGLTETARFGARLGIATLLMMITLIGGRIIPSFTRNWLVKQNAAADRLPAPFGIVDRAALAISLVALIAWVIELQAAVTGALLIAAGIAAAIRLARWRGLATLREPLLLVLHLGHGWLAVGLLLLGIGHLSEAIAPSDALHALTAGAIGTMILAVMTRATLGHTGRDLTAGAGTAIIYGLVTLAALSRIGAGILLDHYEILLRIAGGAWIAAFLLFLAVYGPMLLRPRLRDAAA
jgi:uncharacterized protein involved in response to NO